MALCEQCGSIQIGRARAEPVDKAVALFTGRRPFKCRRCGWRGRRHWSDNDITDPLEHSLSGGASVDPALTVLDEIRNAADPIEKPGRAERSPVREEFDLSRLDWIDPSQSDPEPEPIESGPLVSVNGRDERIRRIVHDWQNRSRRPEVAGAVAMTVAVLLLYAIIIQSEGCAIGPLNL